MIVGRNDPVRVGDAGGVDEIVDQHGGHDLAAQLMRTDVAAELLPRAANGGSSTMRAAQI
jgi:hypothetical protein